MKNLILMIFLTLGSFNIYAKPQTATLAIPSMSCPTCPFTVKLSLKQVNGVDKADVNFNEKQAIVVFDDEKTNVNELIAATTNAGYPSTVINQEDSQ